MKILCRLTFEMLIAVREKDRTKAGVDPQKPAGKSELTLQGVFPSNSVPNLGSKIHFRDSELALGFGVVECVDHYLEEGVLKPIIKMRHSANLKKGDGQDNLSYNELLAQARADLEKSTIPRFEALGFSFYGIWVCVLLQAALK